MKKSKIAQFENEKNLTKKEMIQINGGTDVIIDTTNNLANDGDSVKPHAHF